MSLTIPAPGSGGSGATVVINGGVNGFAKIATYAATELTRPGDTNAYSIGDAIANSTTAGSVVPLQFTVARVAGYTGRVTGALLTVNSASAFGFTRLHLFNQAPFAAAGYQADNAALALTYTALKTGAAGTNPNYIGYIDFNGFQAQSSAAVSEGACDLTELDFTPAAASQVIFGLLEARAAFTPANAGTFNVTLDIVQD